MPILKPKSGRQTATLTRYIKLMQGLQTQLDFDPDNPSTQYTDMYNYVTEAGRLADIEGVEWDKKIQESLTKLDEQQAQVEARNEQSWHERFGGQREIREIRDEEGNITQEGQAYKAPDILNYEDRFTKMLGDTYDQTDAYEQALKDQKSQLSGRADDPLTEANESIGGILPEYADRVGTGVGKYGNVGSELIARDTEDNRNRLSNLAGGGIGTSQQTRNELGEIVDPRSGYEGRLDIGMGYYDDYGKQMNADITEREVAARGRSQNQLTGRGMRNTTIGMGQDRALASDAEKERRRVGEGITQAKANYWGQLSGEALGAHDQALMAQTGLWSDITGSAANAADARRMAQGQSYAQLSGDSLAAQQGALADNTQLALQGAQYGDLRNQYAMSLSGQALDAFQRTDVGPTEAYKQQLYSQYGAGQAAPTGSYGTGFYQGQQAGSQNNQQNTGFL